MVIRQGNIYVADAGNNRIGMETPSVGSYTQSTVPSSSLNCLFGIIWPGGEIMQKCAFSWAASVVSQ